MNVGEYIKKLRIENGYSQEELGQLIGVQRAAVQKWESGKVKNLKRETIKKLSQIFNVPPSDFIVSDDLHSAIIRGETYGINFITKDGLQMDILARLVENIVALSHEKLLELCLVANTFATNENETDATAKPFLENEKSFFSTYRTATKDSTSGTQTINIDDKRMNKITELVESVAELTPEQIDKLIKMTEII